LGEALLGMDLVNSGIPTQFKSIETRREKERERS
jgi:hypothetical protein